MPTDHQPSLFISYARDDDEPFAKRLHDDLAANGIQVWWDRTAMESRGRTFLQEIRDAIASVDRLVLVIGPKAAQSAYVRAEWQQALNECKVINPILRLGDWDLLPKEIAGLHGVDMRESHSYHSALQELLRLLKTPIMPLGEVYGVPALPPHFLPRPEVIASLQQALFADITQPTVVASAKRSIVLQGMGGIGKTVMAAAFAHACGTRRACSDGVIWLTVGQRFNPLGALQQVGRIYGDPPQDYSDINDAPAQLAKVLASKICLLVLDDVWDMNHAKPFVDALGTRCRLLITTRDGGLASNLGAQLQSLEVLSNEAALQLLAEWSEHEAGNLPAEARAVAQECGNVPLALAQSGATARSLPWAEVLAALRKADLAFIEHQFPHNPQLDVMKSLKLSFDTFSQSDLLGAQRYSELVVFQKGVSVPEVAVLMLWLHTGGLNDRAARKLLTLLKDKSLLQLDGEVPNRRMSLHDLQRDYLDAIQEKPVELHKQLLTAYRKKCADGWSTGPNDGYYFEHLLDHLKKAERQEEIRPLLTDYRWLQAKLNATHINAVLDDYARYPSDLVLQRIATTLHQVIYALTLDKAQLAQQLLGRLLDEPLPEVQALLKQAGQLQEKPWLRPRTACLREPEVAWALGDPAESIVDIAVTPDGQIAVCAVSNSRVIVWDLANGRKKSTLITPKQVGGVAINEDGHMALLAFIDRTLHVWDLITGTEYFALPGNIGVYKSGLAMTPDGRLAISASDDNKVTIWDLVDRKEKVTLAGHKGVVTCVAITPDGCTAISGSEDSAVKVWDLASKKEVFTLSGHQRELLVLRTSISGVAISADGQVAISSCDDILKVWDLNRGKERLNKKVSVSCAAITSDGQTAVSCDSDGLVTGWNLIDGTIQYAYPSFVTFPKWISITKAKDMAVVSNENILKVCNTLRKRETLSERKGEEPQSVKCIALTSDGSTAISVSQKSTCIWDSANGRLLRELPALNEFLWQSEGEGYYRHAAISADRQIVVASPATKTPMVQDLVTGREKLRVKGHHGMTSEITAIAVTPDGHLAATGASDKTIKIWDLTNGVDTMTLRGHTNKITCIALVPDGTLAMSGSTDGTLRVWNLTTGKQKFTLALQNEPYRLSDYNLRTQLSESQIKGIEAITNELRSMHNALSISADGQLAVSVSSSRLAVWDLVLGREKFILTNEAEAAVIMPSGELAVSVHDDELTVWDLTRQKRIAVFYANQRLAACAINNDGTTIVAGGQMGGMYFLQLVRD
jgi:WD40 repeat protein